MAPPAPQTLPSKEQNLFKNLVKFYEQKQYKKGLKNADTILKKFPNHGETLAMKGLILHTLDISSSSALKQNKAAATVATTDIQPAGGLSTKENAYALVREGLRHALRSHVCWHVYGLLYRADRNYREASKAYLQALRIDKENTQILRDLALLQVQLRDYEGFSDSRRTLLTLKPGQKVNWYGFAVSMHLLQKYSVALDVINAYESTTKTDDHDVESAYERSEALLYKLMILEESGDYQKTYDSLMDYKKDIVDKLQWREIHARVLVKLNRLDEAESEYRNLIRINPDNYDYLKALEQTIMMRPVDQTTYTSNRERSFDIFAEVAAAHKYSQASLRIPLDLLDGNDPRFLSQLDSYVRKFLIQNIPSLYTDLKSLYQNKVKVEKILELFKSFDTELSAGNTLPSQMDDLAVKQNGHSSFDSKLIHNGVLFFLARLHDRLGNHQDAINCLNRAFELKPDDLQLYMAKAKIFKHLGDYKAALAYANIARKLDLADRYLNTKCTKYALRANHVFDAENCINLFVRDGDAGGIQMLYDLQCMWFLQKSGESFMRQMRFAQAFKRFTAVDKNFTEIIEDQFDFHNYCLRKLTLCAYIKVLRMEDNIKAHEAYRKAISSLVAICFTIFDNPSHPSLLSKEDADMAKLTPAERKKAIAKLKKSEQKKKQQKEKEEKEAVVTKGKNEKKGSKAVNNNGWMMLDPEGEQLLKSITQPLEEATRHIVELETSASEDVQTHVLRFEVSLRKKRYLLALRAIERFRLRNGDPTQLLCMLYRLFSALDDQTVDSLPKPVQALLMKAKTSTLKEQTLTQFFNSSSCLEDKRLSNQFMLAEARYLSAKSEEDQSKAWNTVKDLTKLSETYLTICETSLQRLQQLGVNPDIQQAFKEESLKLHPFANAFGGSAPQDLIGDIDLEFKI